MALTKPKLSQNIDTDISVFTDPILVLHQGSTLANVDTGFLFNRANGLVSNVAIYWSESANSFVTAFTTSSGAPDANISITTYANLRAGTIIANSISTTGTSGNISGVNYIFSDNYAYSNGVSILTGIGGTYSNTNVSAYLTLGANIGSGSTTSNLVAVATTTSTSTTTGALVVRGGAGIAGNVYANALRTTTGIYWAGNGNPITGITYTASASSPSGPNNGDQWYNTSNDVLYEYVFDGTSSYWVDVQTSVIAANAVVTIPELIQANIGAFQTYANTKIGTNTNSNLVVDATTTSTSTTTGALVVAGGAGIASNINIGGNASITSNLTVTQSGLFRGPYNENSTLSGVFVGNTGTAPGITPRVGFFNGNTQQNWQIDNNGGEFRWFVPGTTRLSLYPNGNLNVVGSLTVGGKRAVNGPAFRAFVSVGQTIVGNGTQQRVTFGSETFDTDNNFTSSQFTPTVEGYYQLNSTVRISGTAGTGENMLVLYKNGGEYARGTNGSGTEIGASFYSMQVSDIAYANGTTDFFEVFIQQGSGGNRDTTAGTNISYFSGCMIRGA
jgi:hypothetical protein